jgi:hypothetical protein
MPLRLFNNATTTEGFITNKGNIPDKNRKGLVEKSAKPFLFCYTSYRLFLRLFVLFETFVLSFFLLHARFQKLINYLLCKYWHENRDLKQITKIFHKKTRIIWFII